MRIDPVTGSVSLGEIMFWGGMPVDSLPSIPGLKRNSRVGDDEWWWVPKLEGYDWTPFFKKKRLCSIHFDFFSDFDGRSKPTNDALLIEMLGTPTRTIPIGGTKDGWQADWTVGGHSLLWDYGWGYVFSGAEFRDWTPVFGICWKT